jgi:hypothetical protein
MSELREHEKCAGAMTVEDKLSMPGPRWAGYTAFDVVSLNGKEDGRLGRVPTLLQEAGQQS